MSEPAQEIGALTRFTLRLAASKPGTWLFLNVIPYIDRPLLRLTRGRLSFSVGQPVLLLETTGAKSGLKRSTPLLYTPVEDKVVIIASNGGQAKHPAWYHNLRKHPVATLTLAGERADYRARDAQGDERAELWKIACAKYPGFATYQGRAGRRRIPVVVMERDGAQAA